MKNNIREFNEAITYLKMFLDYRVYEVAYKVVSKTTNNFQKFKDETSKNGYILVSSEGCNNTIYDSVTYNIKGRIWHDLCHLHLNLDFTKNSELLVYELQLQQLMEWCNDTKIEDNIKYNLQRILYADIVGQVLYYEKYNTFVENQKVFVLNMFLNNIRGV